MRNTQKRQNGVNLLVSIGLYMMPEELIMMM